MERNARKIKHAFDFLAFQTLSSRQLNNRGFSLIILTFWPALRLVLRYESFFHRYGVHTSRTLTFLNILRLRSGFKLLRCRNGSRYSSLFWNVVFVGFGMVTQQGRNPASKPIHRPIRFVFECNVAGIRLFFRCDYWSHPNPHFLRWFKSQ